MKRIVAALVLIGAVIGLSWLALNPPAVNNQALAPGQTQTQPSGPGAGHPGQAPAPATASAARQSVTPSQLNEMIDRGEIRRVFIAREGTNVLVEAETTEGRRVTSRLIGPESLPAFEAKLQAKGIPYQPVEFPRNPMADWGPILLIIGIGLLIVWFLRNQMRKMQGGGANDFMKSPAQEADVPDITLDDVGGIDHVKPDLRNWVDMLVSYGKLGYLGGEVPKGLLLVGPPGTGKTLTARAMCGEANKRIADLIAQGKLDPKTPKIHFMRTSGSEFVQMFVGVGAARVRSLFQDARKKSPCVIFIDEVDALGKRDGGNKFSGGNDEKTQTLNQILVEMDGFNPNEKILVIAATNRPDMLDEALKRPGRFDRQVVIPKPDVTGRFQILQVLAKKRQKKAALNRAFKASGRAAKAGKPLPNDGFGDVRILADNIDLMDVARQTPDMSGAELDELLNRAAQFAEKEDAPCITWAHIEKARADVVMGPEMPRTMSFYDRFAIAVHETGHAVIAKKSYDKYGDKKADPVHSVTIMPRGQALGLTWTVPVNPPLIHGRSYWVNRIRLATGGDIAETYYLGEKSPGNSGDIQMATAVAQRMVMDWGMSPELGFRKYSEETFVGKASPEKVDQAVTDLLNTNYEVAELMFLEDEAAIERVVRALLKKTTITGPEFDALYAGQNPGFDCTLSAEDEAALQAILKECAQMRQTRLAELQNKGVTY